MSDWKLAGEHVAFKRPLEAPSVLRPSLGRSLYHVSYYLVLSDPALSASGRWLGLYEATGDNAVQWLQAYTDTTPKMVRYYFSAEPGTGFRAETPMYEGHWRATRDEQSELPWPVPDPQWTDMSPPGSQGTTFTGITGDQGTTPKSLSVRREGVTASRRRCVWAIRRDPPRRA